MRRMPVLLQGLLLRQPGVAWRQSGGWAHLSTESTALNVDVTAEDCRACINYSTRHISRERPQGGVSGAYKHPATFPTTPSHYR